MGEREKAAMRMELPFTSGRKKVRREEAGLRGSRKSSVLDVFIWRCLLGIEWRWSVGGWIYVPGEKTKLKMHIWESQHINAFLKLQG